MTCLEGRVMAGHYYPYCPQPDLSVGLTSHSDNGSAGRGASRPHGRDDPYGPLPELVSPEKPAPYRQFTLSEFMQRFFNKGMMMASEHDPQIDPFD
ncbi:hypothetical protein ACFX2I_036588 [Malus domestica]